VKDRYELISILYVVGLNVYFEGCCRHGFIHGAACDGAF
jgi:hypothetical protein